MIKVKLKNKLVMNSLLYCLGHDLKQYASGLQLGNRKVFFVYLVKLKKKS